MKDTSKKALRRGHNEGNIRQRTDGRWEVRLSAGIDYKTGKPRRTSTCCNTRQEAIAILQQQAHEVRTQGWRDPMSVTLGEWYEYWLDTYMKDTVKQSTYASYRSYLNKHFCVLGKILLKKLEPHTLQEFYNYKFREEGLSPKTLRNYHMALHNCLQQAVKERLLIVTNEFGHYFEQKTFKDYYDRLLKDADIGHFTFHALRHTFATRALERGMDYKTLSAILGHYSVAFTMDTYVHSMDEHKRHEMDKMDDMFGMQYSIFVENQPYPVLCTLSPDGCTAHVPDFPKIVITASTLDAALLEVKQQIQKALRQYKNPPIPTKQEQIVVPQNSVLVLVKAS